MTSEAEIIERKMIPYFGTVGPRGGYSETMDPAQTFKAILKKLEFAHCFRFRMEVLTECDDSGIGNDKSMTGDDDEESVIVIINNDNSATDDSAIDAKNEKVLNNGKKRVSGGKGFPNNNITDEKRVPNNDKGEVLDDSDDDKTVSDDRLISTDDFDKDTENNESKLDDFESVLSEGEGVVNDKLNDVSNLSTECEDMFEDCEDEVGERDDGKDDFDRMNENYSLEMKLALGIDRNV